ncbi:hypothetical protein EG856_00760 [Mycoplasmopsis phocirhinis]|uniref:Variable surface lipoprotein n=1 Tax=Mycoplasmopsis phocirhinis TaxID=142650 RepID=A0A4P6MNJ8_9BACT|nr:hypothetical protein [Mycoplasmopsis phocirhinis]QBF34460.1 hypothetical protein EG856_00760 [Mycoplasmopsis phocirhinis]
MKKFNLKLFLPTLALVPTFSFVAAACVNEKDQKPSTPQPQTPSEMPKSNETTSPSDQTAKPETPSEMPKSSETTSTTDNSTQANDVYLEEFKDLMQELDLNQLKAIFSNKYLQAKFDSLYNELNVYRMIFDQNYANQATLDADQQKSLAQYIPNYVAQFYNLFYIARDLQLYEKTLPKDETQAKNMIDTDFKTNTIFEFGGELQTVLQRITQKTHTAANTQ